MILKGRIYLRLGTFLTGEGKLQDDRAQWKGQALMPEIVHTNFSDENLLRALLYESTPVIISAAEDDDPVVLEAELLRFPYTIHSAKGGVVYRSATGFASFALRLVPVSGKIISVELDRTSHVAVNELFFEPNQWMLAEFGNGHLRFELYFGPSAGLPPLRPPENYKEEVTIHDENAID